MASRSFLAFRIGFGAVLMIVAAFAYFEAGKAVPPTSYEPLGPAAVPQGLAVLILILSAIMVARAAREYGRVKSATRGGDAPAYQPRYDLAAIAAALTVIYVLLFGLHIMSFRWATVLFLTALCMLLNRFRPRQIPISLAVAVAFGFGIHYLFTRVFVVGLP